MRAWRLFLAAHGATSLLASWVAFAIAVVVADDTVLSLDVVTAGPPRDLPLWELFAVLCAATSPGLVAPRLWSWESAARRPRIRLRAAALGAATIAIPSSLPWLAHVFVLPPGVPWWDSAWNAALVASLATLGTVWLSPRLGAALALIAYAAIVVLQQLLPDLAPLMPLARVRFDLTGEVGGNLSPAVWPILALIAVSVLSWALTLGRSRASDRRSRND